MASRNLVYLSHRGHRDAEVVGAIENDELCTGCAYGSRPHTQNHV
jgi:hypothetical protein